tara:strand:+ start:138 stop:332 length:195 start_codon:yes stop_codon:yes gene_type:complete
MPLYPIAHCFLHFRHGRSRVGERSLNVLRAALHDILGFQHHPSLRPDQVRAKPSLAISNTSIFS